MRKVLAVAAGLLLLAGCAGTQHSKPVEQDTDNRGMIAVTITVSSDAHNVIGSRNVVCTNDKASGSHPDPEKACEVLRNVDLKVFEPVPEDMSCTMQYGGPEKGEIRGTYGGTISRKDIEAQFSRTNGCEMDRWAALEGVWYDPLD